MFLFQMTMPVTVAALGVLLPRRPGLAFGLACVALIGGSVPTFYHAVKGYYGTALFVALILASAAALFVALGALRGRERA